jgi:DNA-binding MarR family transcriptional regulator
MGQLEERIAGNLVDLMQIFRIMRTRAGSEGIKPMDPQYTVMGILLHEDLPISEIGSRLCRSKPNMTALIGKLLREGKVKRVPDRKDRRITRIAITRKGEQAMEKRKAIVKECIKKNLSGIRKRDLERFCSSLETVNEIALKVARDRHD